MNLIGGAASEAGGAIAAVKIWTAALTNDEILAEQYSIRPERLANLYAWYPLFGPTSAEWLRDYSGNASTLTAGSETLTDGPPVSWGAPVIYVMGTAGAEPSESPSASPSASPSISPSASESPSYSPSVSPSRSPSASPSISPSESPSASPSRSPSASESPSYSPSVSPSISPSVSPSVSPSISPSASESPSYSPSISPSGSPSASPSISPSASPSISPSASESPSYSPSPSESRSASASPSPSPAGVQHAYAISDALAGTWTASTGSDLYEMINEVYPPVDTDYIISAASPDNDTCAVNLTALSTPVEGTVTMRVRAKWAS